MNSYREFLGRKLGASVPTGFEPKEIKGPLYPHQTDLVNWSIRRGRSAIFADTGLGKTRMQVAWADAVASHSGGDILILAPLAVAEHYGLVFEATKADAKREYGVIIVDTNAITGFRRARLESFANYTKEQMSAFISSMEVHLDERGIEYERADD